MEFIAGNGISLTIDRETRKITISSNIEIPVPLDKGGTGRVDLTSEDIDNLKRIKEFINNNIPNKPVEEIWFKSTGYHRIEKGGRYELKLCGGGASGAGSQHNSTNNGYGGAGGNSGYLVTKIITIKNSEYVDVTIGAGGIFYKSMNVGAHGNETKVNIGSLGITVAKGGEVFRDQYAGAAGKASIPIMPSTIYDEKQGSTMGGCGTIIGSMFTGASYATLRSKNGMDGIMRGGVCMDIDSNGLMSYGGGGGSGIIEGDIEAGIGSCLTTAKGYGAGGGGSALGNTGSVKFGGDGAQGVVVFKYLGE